MKVDLVVGGYIFHDDRILLTHYKKLDLWIPPGGHIDKNETPDEALPCKIKEEFNLDVEILTQSDIPMKVMSRRTLRHRFMLMFTV